MLHILPLTWSLVSSLLKSTHGMSQNVGMEKGLHKSEGSQNTADALRRENVIKMMPLYLYLSKFLYFALQYREHFRMQVNSILNNFIMITTTNYGIYTFEINYNKSNGLIHHGSITLGLQ